MKNKFILLASLFILSFFSQNINAQADCCAGFYFGDFTSYCIANLDPCNGTSCSAATLEAAHGLASGPGWNIVQCTGGPPNCSASCVPGNISGTLPIELANFSLNYINNSIELYWLTASEVDNEGFEIERSKDGLLWEYLDFVEGNGTTTELQNYRYIDKNPLLGFNYYRLKQLDFDGGFEYSYVRVGVWQGSTDPDKLRMAVLPNPATTWMTVALPGTITKDIDIQFAIYDQVGRLVKRTIIDTESQIRIDLDGLSEGYYILHASQKNFQYSTTFIKK